MTHEYALSEARDLCNTYVHHIPYSLIAEVAQRTRWTHDELYASYEENVIEWVASKLECVRKVTPSDEAPER